MIARIAACSAAGSVFQAAITCIRSGSIGAVQDGGLGESVALMGRSASGLAFCSGESLLVRVLCRPFFELESVVHET